MLGLAALPTSTATADQITGTHGLKVVARLTGTPSLNNTTSPYDIGGSDLGIPVYHNGKTYLLFGDTFSGETTEEAGNWRRNSVAWTTDATPGNGVVFDGMAINPLTGYAKQTFTNNQTSGSAVITNIPTGAISVGGNLYAWFMNVTQWGPVSGQWQISQAELARWNDDTTSFELVPNNTFPHNSNFGMVAARQGVNGDPYIYLWGTAAGRFNSGVKLARFLPTQIENRASYQFFNGMQNSIPQWTSDEFSADLVVAASVGEMSVMYNEAVGAWTMMYFNELSDRFEIRQSDTPWGVWSSPITVMKASQCPSGTYGLYAPYMHPEWVDDSGATLYFTMSLWYPYDVFMARVVLDIAPLAPTPPSGTVTINSGSQYATSGAVVLALSATDDSGTVSQMRISNDGAFDSEPWESFATTKNWTLTPGDGLKTVSVQFRDPSLTPSATASDSIILTTSPPGITEISVSPNLVAAGDSVRVNVTADSLAVVTSVSANWYVLNRTGESTWERDIPASATEGTHAVTIRATDSLGRVTTNPSSSYITTRVLGIAANRLSEPVLIASADKWLFRLWGVVQSVDPHGFTLEDASGAVVRVVCPGLTGVSEGDYVSARGQMTPGTPPSLTSLPAYVTKLTD